MSLIAHLETLEEKHIGLEGRIAEESARPSPDFTLLTQMKKQKLKIKEEIEKIARIRTPQEAAVIRHKHHA